MTRRKKILIGIAAIVIVLVGWQILSGWATSRKLYDMALDNFRADQTRVIGTLEENMKSYEAKIARLNRDIEQNKKQQAIVRAETERLKGVIRGKDIQIAALKKERESVTVPGDAAGLVNEFQQRGYGSVRTNKRP